MNASAATTCLVSSRVTSRTRAFVSTARTAPPDVAADALLHLGDRARSRRPGKERPMNVLGRVPPCFSDDDLPPFVIPLQDRARTHTEPLPDLRRNRDLSLCCELRVGECHITILPG
jgi:hypothetical protein